MNPIELAADACGTALVRVQFAKAQTHAVLHLTDYERVIAAIGHASWFLNSSGNGHQYVRAWDASSSRNVMIARLLLGIERGAVRCHDGDSLNLRRANLIRPLRR
ncbi:hypothetical protein [Bosea sp. (in: a-proteobacteria)]|uniref:hypothetical protein n=1 Tax=Bosea sp. (in: a-proteobacteria) TaxID=1871050 RepID=UPI00273573E7|nr:hypothetical protein [Bosea sp. (in: a-proteobacteria)]MDP3255381.1 hypothetical protein [Bosea sp. (in: a-proteobacteria)]